MPGSSSNTRLHALQEQDQALASELDAEAPATPDTAALQAVADQLGQTIAHGNPDQAKALLRILIAELQVNSRSEILPTYRLSAPTVCAQTSPVGDTGLELASGAQVRPNTPVLLGFDALRSAQVRSNCYQNCYQARASRSGRIENISTSRPCGRRIRLAPR